MLYYISVLSHYIPMLTDVILLTIAVILAAGRFYLLVGLNGAAHNLCEILYRK